jgi:hypothetical protein
MYIFCTALYQGMLDTKFSIVTKLHTGCMRNHDFYSWQRQEICLFREASRATLGPPQPPIQEVLGYLSAGLKQLERAAEHLSSAVLRLRMRGSMPPLPCLHLWPAEEQLFFAFPQVIYDLGCRREIAMLESSSKRQEQRLRSENEWLERDFQARMTRMQVCNCYITLICICRGHGTVTLEMQSEEQISPLRSEVAVSLETVVQLYQAT